MQEVRNSLYRRIQAWRKIQDFYMPQVMALREDNGAGRVDDDDVDVTVVPSELLELFLPSDLSEELQNLPALRDFVSREGRMRIAQAEDSLSAMRRRLCVLSEVFKFKDKQLSGQGNRINTCARNLYARFRKKVDFSAARYRRARAALVRLDPRGSWRTNLLPLLETDVRPMRSTDDTPGEGDFVLTWIWRRAPQGDLDVPHDSVRVEWAKMKARVERWDEESALLVEEMRRVVTFLRWKCTWWSSRASSRDSDDIRIRHGASAFAHKQADNYSHLSNSFIHRWGLVLDELHIGRPLAEGDRARINSASASRISCTALPSAHAIKSYPCEEAPRGPPVRSLLVK